MEQGSRAGTGNQAGLYANVFYSARDVARLLSAHLDTVWELMRDPDARLPSTRVTGRTRRVYGEDLAAFLGVDAPLAESADGHPGLYQNVFYSLEEVAKILGISVRTVYRLVATDGSGLQCSRLVRPYQVYGAHLAAFIGVPLELVPILGPGRKE